MTQIKECKASKYIENLNEINSFIQAKKKIDTLDNTERLLNLIKIYFETILYHQTHSPSKFHVKIKGKIYESVLNAFDENGNPIKLEIKDISERFIIDVIKEIRKNLTVELFEKLIILLNSILVNRRVLKIHKLLLINSENNSFQNEWDKLIRLIPEKLATESLQIRKKIITEVLKAPSSYQNDEHLNEFIDTLNRAYIFYTKFLIKVQIANNHIIDVFKTIQDELNVLNSIKDIKHADIKSIVYFLLNELTSNNNLFLFDTKDEIKNVLEDYKEYIDEEQLSNLREFLNFNPENFTLGNATVELANQFLKCRM